MKHPKALYLIEKRLSLVEQQQAKAHLTVCSACRAEVAETAQVVDMLETIPVALRALAWRREQLWPVIWNGVQLRMPVFPVWQYAVCAALLICLGWISGFGLGRETNKLQPAAVRVPYAVCQTATAQPALALRLATATQTHWIMTPTPAPIPPHLPLPGDHL